MKNIMTAPSPKSKFMSFYQKLGPGVLMASAAVGGSHLVASTQAGALYGWQLVGLILLVNLLKYPFFLAGVQYSMATKKTLVEGYAEMGKPYLLIFSLLTGFSAFVNTAALLLFSASLMALFIPFAVNITLLSAIIFVSCLLILMAGHFKALDFISKVIMAVLTLSTIVAVFIAAGKPVAMSENFVPVSPWTLASLGFIVATMGWMPAPIEISSINSVWLKRQSEIKEVDAKTAIFDFNVGYVGTAILAIFFVALGALLMYGTDAKIAMAGTQFAYQLVNIYATTIGEWARYLIALIAFFCIFGSAITCVDGYSRVCAESVSRVFKLNLHPHQIYNFWCIAIAIGSFSIVAFYKAALLPMMNFAMVAAFMTTPFFALLNYILVTRTALPAELRLNNGLKALSIFGLIYLFGFLVVFVWWKWLM